ncbi:hypothetical protein N1851_025250 [Merluccius polli]|uniref:Uncharacterized protein n=1 Tax=Merluccius polli TaxID=89951 RepID=A0AA47NW99_MERPO|nr:hypothetical protein N1851_025250 [Merluccius polli]
MHFLLVSQKSLYRNCKFHRSLSLDFKDQAESIPPVFAELHLHLVSFRIDFKVLLITYKALNGTAPLYNSDFLISYQPQKGLRSSNAGPLIVPKVVVDAVDQVAEEAAVQRLSQLVPVLL